MSEEAESKNASGSEEEIQQVREQLWRETSTANEFLDRFDSLTPDEELRLRARYLGVRYRKLRRLEKRRQRRAEENQRRAEEYRKSWDTDPKRQAHLRKQIDWMNRQIEADELEELIRKVWELLGEPDAVPSQRLSCGEFRRLQKEGALTSDGSISESEVESWLWDAEYGVQSLRDDFETVVAPERFEVEDDP